MPFAVSDINPTPANRVFNRSVSELSSLTIRIRVSLGMLKVRPVEGSVSTVVSGPRVFRLISYLLHLFSFSAKPSFVVTRLLCSFHLLRGLCFGLEIGRASCRERV